MMMRRIKIAVLAIVAILVTIGAANAAITLTATPTKVKVQVNGTANVTLNFTDNTTSGIYKISYTINNTYVLATLSGPYLDPNFTQTTPYTNTTLLSTTGAIQWNGVANTPYYFKLTLVSNTSTPNQGFLVTISGVAVNISTVTIDLTGTTVVGNILPELFTVALVLSGIGAIVLIKRRK